MQNNIMIRGERGDHREQSPQFFYLKCPTCGNFKNCAHIKLFTTTARGLTCSSCKKSTSSTRWTCEHGTPWTRCSYHREPGFRCGVQSLPSISASFKGTNSMTRSSKAILRRQAKLRVIGSLGEPKRPPVSRVNSVNSSTFKRTSVLKKKLKRRGSPPLNGESRLRRPELHDSSIPHTRLSNCSNEHDTHRIDYSACMATSTFWRAHSGQGQIGGSTTSNNSMQYFTHKAGSVVGRPPNPAKKARISEPFSMQASSCKGMCPRVWTIESYCEACHG